MSMSGKDKVGSDRITFGKIGSMTEQYDKPGTSNLFQALGKPFQAGFLGLCRQLFSLLPCVIIMTHFWGLTGLSLAQAASDVVSFTFALIMVIPMMKELNQRAETEGED